MTRQPNLASMGPPPRQHRISSPTDFHDFPTAQLRQFGPFLNPDATFRLVLCGVSRCGYELRIMLLDGIDGVGQHLSYTVDVLSTGEHVASERIPEAMGCDPLDPSSDTESL